MRSKPIRADADGGRRRQRQRMRALVALRNGGHRPDRRRQVSMLPVVPQLVRPEFLLEIAANAAKC